jgi:hypothetical protein
MTGEVPKKRMSKGCLIALIVVGVILLLVIAIGILWCLKGDEMIKNSTTKHITEFKTKLNDSPIAGINTVRVNVISDAFIEKFNKGEVDLEKFGHFAKELQEFQSDKDIDSTDAESFMQAMIEYFPELKELIPVVEIENSTFLEDSISKE